MATGFNPFRDQDDSYHVRPISHLHYNDPYWVSETEILEYQLEIQDFIEGREGGPRTVCPADQFTEGLFLGMTPEEFEAVIIERAELLKGKGDGVYVGRQSKEKKVEPPEEMVITLSEKDMKAVFAFLEEKQNSGVTMADALWRKVHDRHPEVPKNLYGDLAILFVWMQDRWPEDIDSTNKRIDYVVELLAQYTDI